MPEGTASRQLRDIAVRLKQASNPASARGVRLQMTRGLREGVKPLIEDARAKARETLPKSGGLADREADQKIPVSVRTGARTAGVRVIARKLGGYQADKYGYVRHPTYGRRAKGQWRNTETPAAAGWFTDTFANGGGKVTPKLLKVLEETAVYINGGGIL